ncbi:MAG: PIG-L family deacetylase [Anaerolineae bacterium]
MQTSPPRVLAFGAHPDDCEVKSAGLARKIAQAGGDVLFVSLTNGDAGHYREAGVPLARRRQAETRAAAEVLGVRSLLLDNHDGELCPTLALRRTVIRLIREFRPDLVLTHRLMDYHPDHRATAQLIQDAAYMVTVPNVCPLTPHLAQNPVIAYFQDAFRHPAPFRADVVVAVDEVMVTKLPPYTATLPSFTNGYPSTRAYSIPCLQKTAIGVSGYAKPAARTMRRRVTAIVPNWYLATGMWLRQAYATSKPTRSPSTALVSRMTNETDCFPDSVPSRIRFVEECMSAELSSGAQRALRALRARGLDLRVVELPASTRTAAEAAVAIGCTTAQIVKSLVFEMQETHRPILVLASGVNRVDEEAIARQVGQPVAKALPDFVREHTGFAIGGVPPVTDGELIDTFIDEDLLSYPELWAAAGTPHAVVCLTANELASLAPDHVVCVRR